MYLSYIVTDIDTKLEGNTEGWSSLRTYPMLSSQELFDPYEPIFKSIQELLVALGYEVVDNHVFINKHNPKMPKQLMFRHEELNDVVELTKFNEITERFTRVKYNDLLVECIACKFTHNPSGDGFSPEEIRAMKKHFERDPMLAA
jgi:hypothetical protein